MSTYTIGSTAATFTAVLNLSDKIATPESYTFGVHVTNSTDWGALASLLSENVITRLIPGSNPKRAVVDVGAGPGSGSLVLDNFTTYTAILTNLERTEVDSGATHSVGTATFLITA